MVSEVASAGAFSTKWTYLFSFFTTVFGMFTVQEWAAIAGIVLGFLTFITNLWFRFQHLKIERVKAESSGDSKP